MSAGARPLRADARRNRARILEVAGEVFASEGINAAIDDIAEKAGVGVGTIYRHFPTKEALFQAIVQHRIDSMTEDIVAFAEADDPGPAFFAMFRKVVHSGRANRDFFEAMAAGSGTDLSALSAEHGQTMQEAMGLVLRRAQEAGAVRPGITAADVKALLVGAHAVLRHTGGDEQALATALDVICDGLRGK